MGLTGQDVKEILKQFELDVNRLVGEWVIHGTLKLLVDYDDTISPYRHCTQEQCNEVIELVLEAMRIGAHIIIHTAGHENNYPNIHKYCVSKGIEVASINKNPVEMTFGNWGKPYGNWILDDRAGLIYSMRVLREAMKLVRFHNEKIKPNL